MAQVKRTPKYYGGVQLQQKIELKLEDVETHRDVETYLIHINTDFFFFRDVESEPL